MDVTYSGLIEQAARVAGGLRELGIERGDRVAVMMSTRAEFLYAWIGINGVGAIEVPIHDAARGPGIAYILNTTGAKALIVDDEHVDHIADYIGDVETLEHVFVTGEPPQLSKPAQSFDVLLGSEPIEFVELEPDEPSSILFTGGTTGPPKGVVLSHSHNLNVGKGCGELFGYTADDVLYSVFPLFHANAKYMSVLAAMAAGAGS